MTGDTLNYPPKPATTIYDVWARGSRYCIAIPFGLCRIVPNRDGGVRLFGQPGRWQWILSPWDWPAEMPPTNFRGFRTNTNIASN